MRLGFIASVVVQSVLLSGAIATLTAQNASLVIQVKPEAHLNPTAIPLTFTVANPGEVVVSQPVAVTAWVRALPGQQILLTAQLGTLAGPNGAAPASSLAWVGALAWVGSMGRATGGGTTAACTSGDFSGGSVQSLISGWNQSGIATCNVSFSLSTDSTWTPGTYTSQANLTLRTQ
jgi:hypothetical protein